MTVSIMKKCILINNFTLFQAFSDSIKGWAIYNGELRHNSNSSGKKYGACLSVGDTVGVALDMINVKFKKSFLLFNK